MSLTYAISSAYSPMPHTHIYLKYSEHNLGITF